MKQEQARDDCCGYSFDVVWIGLVDEQIIDCLRPVVRWYLQKQKKQSKQHHGFSIRTAEFKPNNL